MSRASILLIVVMSATPLLAADPAVRHSGSASEKLPESAKYRLGRSTDFSTTVLAFSSDGKQLATITNRGYTSGIDVPVDVWDVESGKHLLSLRYHTTGVMAAAFSPDGSVIATSGIDNRLRFWDGKSGKDITKADEIILTGHGYSLCFSQDGKRLLVGSTKLELYDVATQKLVKKEYFAETAANMFFHTAIWSPKGNYIAAGCDGAGIRVWDAASGKLLYNLAADYQPNRTRFVFSADDKLILVSASPDRLFKVYDAESGKERSVVKVPNGEPAPEQIQFAREMGRVAWVVVNNRGGQDTLAVADATGAELKRFEVSSSATSHLLSNDGKRVAIGGRDGSLRMFDTESGKIKQTLLGAWSSVFRAVYADGGKVLRTVHTGGTINDFDADTGRHLKERILPLKDAHPISASEDGKYLACATDTGVFSIWNLESGKATATPKTTLFVYRVPGIGPPGRPLPPIGPRPLPPAAKGDADGAQPPPRGGAFPPPPIEMEPGPPQFFTTFSRDGKLFAAVTGKDEGSVAIFDSATGEEQQSIKVPKGVTTLVFSADSIHLFTGHGRVVKNDEQPPVNEMERVLVRRFEIKSGKEVQSWKLQPGEEKPGYQFSRTEIVGLYALADKESLLVIEAQYYRLWPPPPGRPGGRVPEKQFLTASIINLPGREKPRVILQAADALVVSASQKVIGFLVHDTSDPAKPAAVVKVVETDGGKVRAALVGTGNYLGFHHAEATRCLTFHPSGKEIAVYIGDGTVLVVDASKLQEVKAEKREGK